MFYVERRWKHHHRNVHMTEKSGTASGYPGSLVVTMLSAIKRQMFSDGAIKVGELHFAGPVPDECDYPTRLEGTREIDGTWIDPMPLDDGRKEEMENIREHGVFEVVDEKESHDNGCIPLTLKWVDKMKGDVCRSRLV